MRSKNVYLFILAEGKKTAARLYKLKISLVDGCVSTSFD